MPKLDRAVEKFDAVGDTPALQYLWTKIPVHSQLDLI
jgi:hypothetical protein